MTNLQATDDLAIPLGSRILVTGTTGYIGANIAQEALNAGFKVRGTVRNEEKVDSSKKMFKNHEYYEAVIVPDLGAKGAFDEAVKGVDAIIHVASITTLSADPNEVVLPTIHAATDIMRSALAESRVKRFVYTSSSVTTTFSIHNKKFHIATHSWNDEAEQYANLKPPYEKELGYQVYAASKTKAERAVWKFTKDNTPHFAVNVVLPNCNMGRAIGAGGPTGSIVNDFFHGEEPWVPPQYMINVIDDARIHLAATFDRTLANERILAFDSPFTWGEISRILAELRPDKKFADADPNEPRDLSTVDNKLGAELLKKWWGQDGYSGLKESVRQNIVNEP